ncbi:DUF881 domain-containing protein [Alkalibacter saccharofermentans]|uniref:Division initiation protein n=1 Tax=Alkalibacter saccharofermentans DSM 14828 TaxID=1120975 RepID=A0A1M4UHQ0_9FIRM|nr:DUF881 domain-containing protein [Alkalibacter saccharofermentans]SHE56184.1 protein of unknown function [Alkalibacter saccharofermentans DSM 14828]
MMERQFKKSEWQVFVVFAISGLIMAVFFLNTSRGTGSWNGIITAKTIYSYQSEISQLKTRNEDLYQSISQLEEKLEFYSVDDPDYAVLENELYNELVKYDIITGKGDVAGQGLRMELSDSTRELEPGENINNFIIHNSDVLEIINELKSNGAEVIAINGYRLSWDSQIDCAGPVIYIDDYVAGTPFVIEAIGNKDRLYAGLEAQDSIVQLLRHWEINVSIEEKEQVVIKSRDNL